MDIRRLLNLGNPRQREGVKIVDQHLVFEHHVARDLIVNYLVARTAQGIEFPVGNRGG